MRSWCGLGELTRKKITLLGLVAILVLPCKAMLSSRGVCRRCRSSTLLRFKKDDNKLSEIQQEISNLIEGKAINVNSPKQVSLAIFGKVQPAGKAVLELAAAGSLVGLGPNQQRLAQLILKHREITRTGTLPSDSGKRIPAKLQTKAFSTASIVSSTQEEAVDEEDLSDEAKKSTKIALDDARRTTKMNHMSAHERVVDNLFLSKSKIDWYWKEPLEQLSRPSARALVTQLNSRTCPMGFDPTAFPFDTMRRDGSSSNGGTDSATTAGKKGSFLAYCREQKQLYPDCIILTRCGDFYETFGVDAIMLVEHCGLNPMAGKAKAGCPIRNVQQTIDCLISQGFRVAVYEEAADTDSSSGAAATGGSKSRIKSRFLAQIVSAASPIYMYDLVLLANADALVTALPSRPYIGVLSSSTGYTLVEISMEERTVRVSERLTAEAVACHLAANPPADPLFYVPPPHGYATADKQPPFLPSRRDALRSGPGARLRTYTIPLELVEQPQAGISDVQRAKNTILKSLLRIVERQEKNHDRQVILQDFTLVSRSPVPTTNETWTHPLYLETATQLGLMGDSSIPPILAFALPESAPAATKRFLRRYLLNPPPPVVATAMGDLVSFLKDNDAALPSMNVPAIGKVLAMLRAGQASAQVYADVLRAINSTVVLLDEFGSTYKSSTRINSLMILLEFESGLSGDPASLYSRCLAARDVIESVISPMHHVPRPAKTNEPLDSISDFGECIPRSFLERNEVQWRGRVRPQAAREAYERVEAAAERLACAVKLDYWGIHEDKTDFSGLKNPIVQDVFNNLIALKEIPTFVSDENKGNYFHPRDRNGKILRNRYTTDRVQEALMEYVNACELAVADVSKALTGLSETLYDAGHIPAIVQASHVNLILSSAFYHGARANEMGWNRAKVIEPSPGIHNAGTFVDVWPYWMDRSQAVPNTFDLSGMWLLTAPNMSGKSTLMRSTAAAVLLSICGLCAPLSEGSVIGRVDHLFVRGASSDVPSEQKSAFGAEMGDVAALLRCCGEKSVVFVDELGRGTSPRDGTRLAGAVLEAMAVSGMSGIFATHLHDILNLPLKCSDRIALKRMAIHDVDETGCESSKYIWTYRLEDGVCTDSMALLTAELFGLPRSILDRAEDFSHFIERSCTLEKRGTGDFTLESKSSSDWAVVRQLAETTIGQTCSFIPVHWTVPASLDGRSVVYVLKLGPEPSSYYVGESDNFRQRLDQHRSKGGTWTLVEALAFPIIQGKSHARVLENKLIQALAKRGIQLESISDGRSVRWSRS